MIVVNTIETALQNAEEFNFLEIFTLLMACFNLVNKFDLRIFIDCVYLEEIRTNAVMLFRPYLH